jgi:hypothetical protein
MVNTASKCKIETHFQRSQVRSSAATWPNPPKITEGETFTRPLLRQFATLIDADRGCARENRQHNHKPPPSTRAPRCKLLKISRKFHRQPRPSSPLEAAEDKDNDRTQKDALFLFAFLATVAKAKVIFAIAAHRHPLLFVKYR